MKRNIRLFIEDILNSIERIESFSRGLTKEGLYKNELKQSAIIRQIEIIGEAAKNIPDSFKNKNTSIPWKDIIGMRDVVIHGYFKVDIETVWKVIKKDLPILKKQILNIKKDLENLS